MSIFCLFINAEDDPLCKIKNVYEAFHLFQGDGNGDSNGNTPINGAVCYVHELNSEKNLTNTRSTVERNSLLLRTLW
jgi:hypothetical protein